jgi:hypothetical protein
VEPNRKFRPNPLSFGSKTRGQTDGRYLPITGPFHAIRAICADIPTTKLNPATCHSADYHYRTNSDAALRDTVPFDVVCDYDCHRMRKVALLRQRHWWLSTVIASSRCRCTARSADPSRTSHAASAPRGGSLTLPAPPSPTIQHSESYSHLQNCAQCPLDSNEITPCRRVKFRSY